MDKQTLSNYGWVVVLILILSVMIAFAKPFGSFIADGFKAIYTGFGETNDKALGIFGQTIKSPPEVKYYQPYGATFDWGTMELVFYKDGTVDVYQTAYGYGEYGDVWDSGSAVYKDGTIEFDGAIYQISDDGKVLNAEDPNGEKATFTLIPTSIKYLQMGVEYVCAEGEWEYSQTFNADGSGTCIDYYMGEENYYYDVPAGEFKYFDQYVEDHYYNEYDGQTYISRFAVHPSGSKIIAWGGIYYIACEHKNTNIIDDDKYCADCGKLIPSDIIYYQPYTGVIGDEYVEIVFHQDGAVDVYLMTSMDGYMCEANSVRYSNGRVIDNGADMYFSVLNGGKTLVGDVEGYDATLKLLPTSISSIKMNEKYENEYGQAMTFKADGSGVYAEYYKDEELYRQEYEIGSFEYYDEYLTEKWYNEYDDQTYIDRLALHPSGYKIIRYGTIYEFKCPHINTEIRNASGDYTGDKYCTDCGALVEKGTTNVPEDEYIPGLYLAGSNYTKLLYTWDELVDSGHITVEDKGCSDGCFHKSAMPDSLPRSTYAASGYAVSNCILNGDLKLPNDGSILYINDSAFYSCDQIKEIYIPSTIEYIGSSAFAWSFSLESVIFEENNNITDISDGICFGCQSLKEFQIEKLANIEYIGNNAFEESSLEQFDLTNATKLHTIGACAFEYSRISSIDLSNATLLESIGEDAFRGTKITSIDLSKCLILDTIKDEAFNTCENLQYVILPKNIKTIGVNVFTSCPELISITVVDNGNTYMSDEGVLYNADTKTLVKYPAKRPNSSYVVLDGTEVIGQRAFADLTTALNVELVDTVHTISDNAFASANINGIALSKNIKTIGDWAFSGSSIAYIHFDEEFNASDIGQSAFGSCDNLTSVTIPKNMKQIPYQAFRFCENLETVIIPNDSVLEVIGYYAFGQTALKTINFPSTLITIESYAFYDTNLTEVLLPSSLRTIGQYTFMSCSSLKTVEFMENSQLKSIGKYSFLGCSALETITIPASTTFIGYMAFSGCSGLQNVVVEDPSNWIIKGSTTLYLANWYFSSSARAIESLTKSYVNASLEKEITN